MDDLIEFINNCPDFLKSEKESILGIIQHSLKEDDKLSKDYSYEEKPNAKMLYGTTELELLKRGLH